MFEIELNMLFHSIFLIIVIVPAIQCGTILEFQFKTQDVHDAGMDSGGINFEICSGSECCFIQNTDYPYDQWARGVIEGFTGSQLQECSEFKIPDNGTAEVKLFHFGDDGWRGAYVRLLLDSGVYYQCPINDFLDNNDHMYLQCKIGQ